MFRGKAVKNSVKTFVTGFFADTTYLCLRVENISYLLFPGTISDNLIVFPFTFLFSECVNAFVV